MTIQVALPTTLYLGDNTYITLNSGDIIYIYDLVIKSKAFISIIVVSQGLSNFTAVINSLTKKASVYITASQKWWTITKRH